jgi:hypothetical protein
LRTRESGDVMTGWRIFTMRMFSLGTWLCVSAACGGGENLQATSSGADGTGSGQGGASTGTTTGSATASGQGGASTGTTTGSATGSTADASVGVGAGGAGGGAGAGGEGGGGGEDCVQQQSAATLKNKPIDVVFVIDNSGSMSAEIKGVEEQINKNFAAILDAAQPPVDYRVIMLSKFGPYSSLGICVAQPLGGIPDFNNDGHCDTIPAMPVNTAKFFHHSTSIASHDALCKLIAQLTVADTYALQPMGYASVLRTEAFKFLTAVTDDGVSCSVNAQTISDSNTVAGGQTAANAFDTALRNADPTQFGAVNATRKYSFWSIIAQAPYKATAMKPYGDPSPPDPALAPVTVSKCTPSAVDPGTGYQALSILTGGYRYPTCGLNYTDIFKLMANEAIAHSVAPCEYELPPPPMAQTLDLDTVQVKYTSNGMQVGIYDKVASAAMCTNTAFYIESDTIKLCPTLCNTVTADPNAQIDILYGCELSAP